jgi:hypothetical protein
MRAYFVSLVLVGAACGDNHATPDGGKHDAAVDSPADTGSDSGGLHMITVTLTDRPTTPATFSFIVAYQDGNGAWKLAPAANGDDYSFTVNSSTWGVAWTCVANILGANPNFYEVERYYFTVLERTHLTVQIPGRCTDRLPNVSLSGNVSSAPATGAMTAQWSVTGSGVSAGSYTFPTPAGAHDLIVTHASAPFTAADTAAVVRSVTVAGATNQDVNYSTAMATSSNTVTLVPPNGSSVQVKTLLFSANDTIAKLANTTAAPFVTVGLNSSQGQSGDVYAEQIAVTQGTSTVVQQDWVAAAAPQTFSAPPALAAPTASVMTTSPYPLIQTTWSTYANAVGYSWNATQALTQQQCGTTNGGCTVFWNTQESVGYVGTSPTDQVPDLTALAGWDARLQFLTGASVTGSVTAMTSSAGTPDFPSATLLFPGTSRAAAGTSRTFGLASWSVTP